ncbi:hypothetical protein PtB15_17B184 [Puccinia triticina]|nr:hypothetical protein PtB15_17B184 [Puccinia triticina]
MSSIQAKPELLNPHPITITADLNKQKDQRKLEKAKFKNGGPPPSTEPILARNPTSAEMDAAISVVTDPKKFRLYNHRHVRVFDKKLTKDKQQTVVADIVFTDLKDISADKRCDLDWFLAFLEKSKMLEIVGHYVNSKAIKENLEEWKQHMRDADRANEILWDFIPGFSEPKIPDLDTPLSRTCFSSNLTFTSDGFFNLPHKDRRDNERLPFAFLLVIPTLKSTGLSALGSDVQNGH